MKKLLFAAALALAAVTTVQADFAWNWWVGSPAENSSKDIKGCQLGIACDAASIQGAQVSICWNKTDELKAGAQVAWGYCEATKIKNGVQTAFVNRADSASLQLGLLCWNKTGFLPFFVFFNFDPNCFGGN